MVTKKPTPRRTSAQAPWPRRPEFVTGWESFFSLLLRKALSLIRGSFPEMVMSEIEIFRQLGSVESFRRETIIQRNQSGSVLDCWLAVLGGRTSNQRVHED